MIRRRSCRLRLRFRRLPKRGDVDGAAAESTAMLVGWKSTAEKLEIGVAGGVEDVDASAEEAGDVEVAVGGVDGDAGGEARPRSGRGRRPRG